MSSDLENISFIAAQLVHDLLQSDQPEKIEHDDSSGMLVLSALNHIEVFLLELIISVSDPIQEGAAEDLINAVLNYTYTEDLYRDRALTLIKKCIHSIIDCMRTAEGFHLNALLSILSLLLDKNRSVYMPQLNIGNEMNDVINITSWREKISFADWIDAVYTDPSGLEKKWQKAQVIEEGVENTIKLSFEGLSDSENIWTTRDSLELAPLGSQSKVVENWLSSLRIGSLIDFRYDSKNWHNAKICDMRTVSRPLYVEPEEVTAQNLLSYWHNPGEYAPSASIQTSTEPNFEVSETIGLSGCKALQKEVLVQLGSEIVGRNVIGQPDEGDWINIGSSRLQKLHSMVLPCYAWAPEVPVEDENDPIEPMSDSLEDIAAFRVVPRSEHDRFFVDVLRSFVEEDGLETILLILNHGNLSTGALSNALFAVCNGGARELYSSNFAAYFLAGLKQAAVKALLTLPEPALRGLTRDQAEAAITAIRGVTKRSWARADAVEMDEELRLELAAVELGCPYLERNLHGLKTIGDMAAAATLYNPDSLVNTKEKIMAWIKNANIITMLCKGHPQLLQRATELLLLMCREGALEPAHLKQILEEGRVGQPEDRRKIVHKVIGSFLFVLGGRLMSALAGVLEDMTQEEQSEESIGLARDAILVAHRNPNDAESILAGSRMLELLWVTASREDTVDSIRACAKDSLVKAYSCFSLRDQRPLVMETCAEGLRNGLNSDLAVYMLHEVAKLLPRSASSLESFDRSSVIDGLQRKYHILEILASDVCRLAMHSLSPLSRDMIKRRLSLMLFLARWGGSSTVISENHVGPMWDSFGDNMPSEMLDWVCEACSMAESTKGVLAKGVAMNIFCRLGLGEGALSHQDKEDLNPVDMDEDANNDGSEEVFEGSERGEHGSEDLDPVDYWVRDPPDGDLGNINGLEIDILQRQDVNIEFSESDYDLDPRTELEQTDYFQSKDKFKFEYESPVERSNEKWAYTVETVDRDEANELDKNSEAENEKAESDIVLEHGITESTYAKEEFDNYFRINRAVSGSNLELQQEEGYNNYLKPGNNDPEIFFEADKGGSEGNIWMENGESEIDSRAQIDGSINDDLEGRNRGSEADMGVVWDAVRESLIVNDGDFEGNASHKSLDEDQMPHRTSLRALSPREFACFQSLFRLTNLLNGNFIMEYAWNVSAVDIDGDDSVSPLKSLIVVGELGSLVGASELLDLALGAESQEVSDAAVRLLLDIHQRIDSRSESASPRAIAAHRQVYISAASSTATTSCSRQKLRALRLMDAMLDAMEAHGVDKRAPSHAARLRGNRLLLRIILEFGGKGGIERSRSLRLYMYESSTLADVRNRILAEVKEELADGRIVTVGLEVGGRDLKNGYNYRTLSELGLAHGNDTWRAVVKPTTVLQNGYDGPDMDLLLTRADTLSAKATSIFSDWYYKFADSDVDEGRPEVVKMTRDGIAAFIDSCCSDSCSPLDPRVSQFLKYDQDQDGSLSLDEFLALYKETCHKNPKTVWKNLRAHGYRDNLTRVNEDPEIVEEYKEPIELESEDLTLITAEEDISCFEALLNTAEDGDFDTAKHAWRILTRLPTHPVIIDAVRKHLDDRELDELLNIEQPWRMFYTLQVIEPYVEVSNSLADPWEEPQDSFIDEPDGSEEDSPVEEYKEPEDNIEHSPESCEWRRKFIKSNGFTRLMGSVRDLFQRERGIDSIRWRCLILLLKILWGFIVLEEKNVTSDSEEEDREDDFPGEQPSIKKFMVSEEANDFVKLLRDILELFLDPPAVFQMDWSGDDKTRAEVVKQAIELWFEFLKVKNHPLSINIRCREENSEKIFLSCLISTLEGVSSTICFCIRNICLWEEENAERNLDKNADSNLDSEDIKETIEVEKLVDETIEPFFLHLALKTLEKKDHVPTGLNSISLYHLLCWLVNRTPSDKIPGLITTLISHIVCWNVEDGEQAFSGVSKVASSAFHSSKSARDLYGSEVVKALCGGLLFVGEEGAVPVCKGRAAREAGFILMEKACMDSQVNTSLLLENGLKPLLESANLISQQDEAINGKETDERSSTGLAGLVNLGNTCYVNSCLQLLFSCSSIRNCVLSLNLDDAFEIEETKLLRELQKLFARLTLSDRAAINTRHLVSCLQGGQVDIKVQQDAHQFMLEFLDEIQRALHKQSSADPGNPYDDFIADIFEGKQVSQITLKSALEFRGEGVRERQEPFYALSLEVQGVKNVEEALGRLSMTDVIESYSWDEARPREDILKRMALASLPSTLILHLNRFTLDFQSFSTVKLNSEFSFPLELNLEPYTREGLAWREGWEEGPYQLHPKEYYEYLLEAVLVHSGITAEQGHYFTYAKTPSGLWCELNDSSVRPWDPSSRLSVDCFGGSTLRSHANSTPVEHDYWTSEVPFGPMGPYSISRENPQSAYVLLYRRRDSAKLDGSDIAIPISLRAALDEDNAKIMFARHARSTELAKCLNAILLNQASKLNSELALWALEWCTSCLAVGASPSASVHFSAIIKSIVSILCGDENHEVIAGQILDKHMAFKESQGSGPTLKKNLVWDLLGASGELSVREGAQYLYYNMLCIIANSERALYISGTARLNRMVELMLSLLPPISRRWLYMAQFLSLFDNIASMGDHERDVLLRAGVVGALADMFLQGRSPLRAYRLTQNLAPDEISVARIPLPIPALMGTKTIAPPFSPLIECIAKLVLHSRESSADDVEDIMDNVLENEGPIRLLNEIDRRCLDCPDLYEIVLREGHAHEQAASMMCSWAYNSKDLAKTLSRMLAEGIDAADFELVCAWFDVLKQWLKLEDGLLEIRVREVFGGPPHRATDKYPLLGAMFAQRALYQRWFFRCVDALAELLETNAGVRAHLGGLPPLASPGIKLNSIYSGSGTYVTWIVDYFEWTYLGSRRPDWVKKDEATIIFERLKKFETDELSKTEAVPDNQIGTVLATKRIELVTVFMSDKNGSELLWTAYNGGEYAVWLKFKLYPSSEAAMWQDSEVDSMCINIEVPVQDTVVIYRLQIIDYSDRNRDWDFAIEFAMQDLMDTASDVPNVDSEIEDPPNALWNDDTP